MTLTALTDLPLIKAGDDLGDLIQESLRRAGIDLQDGDVLVVAQKIVSKAEGRRVNLADVRPSDEATRLGREVGKDSRLIEVILKESRRILRAERGIVIVEHRLGFVCANAGVDHSNVSGEAGNPEDWVLLLPEDPDASAARLRQQLESWSGQRLGLLIIDSHGRAWRLGVVGVAIGVSGFPALVDLRGEEDIFGYRLRITQIGLADEIAAAASALMGQAGERRPVVHVRGLPYPLREGSLAELLRPADEDLFR
ncbi:MAG TPA: coenzyme F420-0:L-glutamate ligase [Anaerolineales bacterium]|nr:coenzyme F420-0:L-glutamate ligase [Anaerolineales bacterium]